MTTTSKRVKALSSSFNAPATVSALGAALYATFAAGPAHADPIAVNIADVTLGSVPFPLDLDGDGIIDYSFRQVSPGPFGPGSQNELDTLALGNSVVGFVIAPPALKPGTYASALAAGELIDVGTSPGFVSGANVILSGEANILKFVDVPYGEFSGTGAGPAYIGLLFEIPDSTPHYGWVSVATSGSSLTLTCVGYESFANTGIAAGAGIDPSLCAAAPAAIPEPGSLALLVAGAAGVLALRRRQRAHPLSK